MVQTVEDTLMNDGAMTNNAIAVITGMSTQQVATSLNQLKHAEKVHKQPVKGGPSLWSIAAPPVKVKPGKPVYMPLIPVVGDLLEVAGRKADGTVVVRTLEAPNTMYTIQEV